MADLYTNGIFFMNVSFPTYGILNFINEKWLKEKKSKNAYETSPNKIGMMIFKPVAMWSSLNVVGGKI